MRAFRAFIDAPEQIDALEFFGAFQEGELLGVMATSERRKHICCFFVAAAHQRRGIGRKLWEHLLANSKNDLFTVHSSPYAVPVYHKLGFVDTDAERGYRCRACGGRHPLHAHEVYKVTFRRR